MATSSVPAVGQLPLFDNVDTYTTSLPQATTSYVCQYCGKTFTHKRRATPRSPHKFCGIACYLAALRSPAPRRKHGYDARYDAWRAAVVQRDRVCQGVVERNGRMERCGATDNLHAHHMYGWTAFPERRYDIANGLLLCAPCHQLRHPECGVGSRPRTRQPASCIVCGAPISGRGTSGCCLRHWKGFRQPRRTTWEQHRTHGLTCGTCGLALVNSNVSGFCKAHMGPHISRVKRRPS